MYKKAYATRLGGNKYKIHLWDSAGYDEIEFLIILLIKNVLKKKQLILV
jgi:hypothetical protein